MESADSGKVRFRLPRMGCFTIFAIFLLFSCGFALTLRHSVWDVPPVFDIPEKEITVSDPCGVLPEEDTEEIRKLAEDIAENAHCKVAVLFLDEKTAPLSDIFRTVAGEWAPQKGVLLIFALRKYAVRMELLGGEWKLAGWNSREAGKELTAFAPHRRKGKEAIALLKRLKRAVSLAETAGSTPGKEEKEGSPVLYTHAAGSGSGNLSPAGLAILFSSLFLLVGGIGFANGKKARARNLRENTQIRKEYEEKVKQDPEIRLIDANEYKKENSPTHRKGLKILAIVLAVFAGFSGALSELSDPVEKDAPPSSDVLRPETAKKGPCPRIVDEAGVFSPEETEMLAGVIRRMEKNTGGEMMVATVPDLGGKSIEEYSLAVASAWKIGKAGKDNGALLLFAMKERKNRLEIGYGWEGPVNDGRAGELLRSIAPDLRNGKFADGAAKIVSGIERYVVESGEGAVRSPDSGTEKAAAAAPALPAVQVFRPAKQKEVPDPRVPDSGSRNAWALTGILLCLAGTFLGYWGRMMMTSVPCLMIYDPAKMRRGRTARYDDSGSGSSDDYDSSDSYDSDDSSDSDDDDDRGGGSFGGGGASGSW